MKKAGILLLELMIGIILLFLIIDQAKSLNTSAITVDKFLSVAEIEKVFNLDEVNETENFELSSDADIERVYIYMVSAERYQRFVVEYDTASNEIIELPVDESVKTIYYSFPEFATVRAVTVCDSPDIFETANYEIPTPNRAGVVGGSPTRRIFSQPIDSNASNASKNLEFIIYNAFESNEVNADSAIFGKYYFKLRKGNI